MLNYTSIESMWGELASKQCHVLHCPALCCTSLYCTEILPYITQQHLRASRYVLPWNRSRQRIVVVVTFARFPIFSSPCMWCWTWREHSSFPLLVVEGLLGNYTLRHFFPFLLRVFSISLPMAGRLVREMKVGFHHWTWGQPRGHGQDSRSKAHGMVW